MTFSSIGSTNSSIFILSFSIAFDLCFATST